MLFAEKISPPFSISISLSNSRAHRTNAAAGDVRIVDLAQCVLKQLYVLGGRLIRLDVELIKLRALLKAGVVAEQL